MVVPGSQATLALKGTAAIDRDLTLGLATFTVTGGTALVAGTTGGVIHQSKDELTSDLADPARGRQDHRARISLRPGRGVCELGGGRRGRTVLPLVRLTGMPPTTHPEIRLSWTDLGDVNSLVRPPQTQDLTDYVNRTTTFDPAAANVGIEAIRSLIGGWANVGLLNTKLPLINKSIAGVFNYVNEARVVHGGRQCAPGNFRPVRRGRLCARRRGLDPAEVSVTASADPALHDPAEGRFRYLVDYHYVEHSRASPLTSDSLPLLRGEARPTVTFNAQLEFGLNREDGFFLVGPRRQVLRSHGLADCTSPRSRGRPVRAGRVCGPQCHRRR